jgi:hypothetical protein
MTFETTYYDELPEDAVEAEDEDAGAGTESDEDYGAGTGLFAGDRGELSFAQRRALFILLKRKYLDADKYPDEWQTLLESRPVIESRLNDLFLVLVLDEERQFAYKRNAVPETGGRFDSLLRDRQYTLEETVLLIELRERYTREWSSGAAAVLVDREELMGRLESYRRSDTTNRAGTRRREGNAIDGLVEERILLKVNGDTERFRVSPVINAVLSMEKLRELQQWLISDLEGGTQA